MGWPGWGEVIVGEALELKLQTRKDVQPNPLGRQAEVLRGRLLKHSRSLLRSTAQKA